jgi:hypothetical protein
MCFGRVIVLAYADFKAPFVIVEGDYRMGSFRKIALWSFAALAGAAALLYGVDDLSARFRGQPTEQMKVDHFYAAMNRWNQVEYSVGTPVMQTCVDALLPHFGYLPCWYLRRHTTQQIGNP